MGSSQISVPTGTSSFAVNRDKPFFTLKPPSTIRPQIARNLFFLEFLLYYSLPFSSYYDFILIQRFYLPWSIVIFPPTS